jgi:predicted nucleotidyltransferase
MTKKLDITQEARSLLLELIARHLPNTTIWAYGSRVKGTARPQSDLDIVAFLQPNQKAKIAELAEAFEESALPFRVDLFVWDEVPEPFRKNILDEHIVLVKASDPNP